MGTSRTEKYSYRKPATLFSPAKTVTIRNTKRK